MDKLPLVLVFVICFNELVCEITLKRLIVGRVAASLHGAHIIRAPHGRGIVSNCVVFDEVLILYSKLLLIAPPRQDFTHFLPLLWNERLLGER